MKATTLAWSLSLSVLLGCSTERYQEGGFETSDIHARILTPTGAPAVGARVWLVRSQGDSAPAQALDSAWTNLAGEVQFAPQSSAGRSDLGLDAQSGAWLALAPRSLGHSDSATVTLKVTSEISAPLDSSGILPKIFVPGSHFVSVPNANGRTVTLRLPRGQWDVATLRASGLNLAHEITLDSLAITIDSLPLIVPVQPLPQGPDLSLDSFLLDGVGWYANTSFNSTSQWAPLSGVKNGIEFLSSLVTSSSDTTQLLARHKRIGEGIDSSISRASAGIAWYNLPAYGAMAIGLVFTHDPVTDTGMIRALTLTDSAGNGLKFHVTRRNTAPGTDSLLAHAQGRAVDSATTRSATQNAMTASVWYISWTPTSMIMRTADGVMGAAVIRGNFGQLSLTFQLQNSTPSDSSQALIRRVRLYTPRN